MSTKTDRMIALLFAFAQSALAADVVAPARPLDDPGALKSAFAQRIGHPVFVLRFGLGEHYADALVQNAAASDEFDRFEAIPGQAMAEGEPQKAGGIDCKQKIAFADLDLAAGARALTQARDIAIGSGYKKPENVELGADVFCNDFGWRAILLTEADSDAMLEITWKPDGSAAKARQMRDNGWVKVDMKSLLAGAVKAPPAPAKPAQPAPVAGDGRQRDFLQGIEADLARVAAQVGAPLAFKHLSIDATQLSVDVFPPGSKKRVATWLVDADGSLRLWREEETIALDCNKPFSAADFPLKRLPELIAAAPGLIPAMPNSTVKNVHISRGVFCNAPRIQIQIEDDRGYGDIEYDAKGKLVKAEVR
jgi:hypothetical protein